MTIGQEELDPKNACSELMLSSDTQSMLTCWLSTEQWGNARTHRLARPQSSLKGGPKVAPVGSVGCPSVCPPAGFTALACPQDVGGSFSLQ